MKARGRVSHHLQPGAMRRPACIRGMRIRASDLLEMLADGVSAETILSDFPDLECEDISAALSFAAKRVDIPRLAFGTDG
jgi:uncharacterized protein (DUF433 family)